MNTNIISNTTENPFKENDKIYNTKMLLEVPELKYTIVPYLAQQYFFPTQHEITEIEMENLKKTYDVDENNFMHVDIKIDDKICTLHQHISTIKEQNKTYYIYNSNMFNIEGLKIIFENKIPLCFKQTCAILAIQQQDINILSLAFEKDELSETILAYKKILNLEYKNEL